MGRLNRRALNVLLALILGSAVMLGTVASASAATPEVSSLPWFSVQTWIIQSDTTWQPLVVNMGVADSGGYTFGLITLQIRNEFRMVGFVNFMSPITDGYSFAGCGWARGTISGSVCFQGTAQVLPGTSIYDYFSFSLVSGGSYSIGGNVPAGSVQVSS